MTVHAPTKPFVDDAFFDQLATAMQLRGITRWWVSMEDLPDVVIMAEIPDHLLSGPAS